MVELDLSESRRRCSTTTAAFDMITTVSGDAFELAFAVDGTTGSCPDPPGPVMGWDDEGAEGESLKGEPAILEDGLAGVGLDCRPDCEWAVVDYSQVHWWRLVGAGDGEEGRGEAEKEEGGGGSHFLF